MLRKKLFFFVCFFMWSALASADQMYTVNGGNCGGGCINPGVLHSYNPATDTFTLIGTPAGPMVGLDYNQDTGILYGVSNGTECADDIPCQILYTINPDTGALIDEIGPIYSGSINMSYILIFDIAIQPSTGTIYAVADYDDDSCMILRIDPATGEVLSFEEFEDDPDAYRYEIAFAPDGTLYTTKVVSDSDSYTYLEIIDPADGSVISTSPPINYNPEGDLWSMGLGVDSSGTVFASRYDRRNQDGNIGQIYTLGMSESPTLYASLPDNAIHDIAFRWDFNSGAVPTVNEWGLIILAGLLFGYTIYFMKKREA